MSKVFMNVNFVFGMLMVFTLMTGVKSAYAEDDEIGFIEIASPLKITLDVGKLEGFILYKLCEWDAVAKKHHCGLERLLITPQTIAYANGDRVPLSQAKNRLGRYAEIVYYRSDLTVKTLSW